MSNRPKRDNTEIRIEDESTGGQKGSKPARPSLIPPSVRDEVSRVYGFGAAKYDDTNYLKGYPWRLSVDALQRHIGEWEQGRSYDEESSLHHLAHAIWHCATLMMYEWHDIGTDDRIEPALEAGTLHAEQPETAEAKELRELKEKVSKLINNPTGIEGYCVKERKVTLIKNPVEIQMKNGRPAVQGECPDCSTAIFKIGKL